MNRLKDLLTRSAVYFLRRISKLQITSEITNSLDDIKQFSKSPVHVAMLSDKERCTKYGKAIHKEVSEEDIVVDIGAGTGILSLFSAKETDNVYAVERAEIAEEGKKIINKNDFSNSIEFLEKDFRNANVPKADVIVIENIGNSIIDEGVIPKLRYANKELLKENGEIIPKCIEVILQPVETTKIGPGFWNRELYGFDFSAAKPKREIKTLPEFNNGETKELSNAKTVLSIDTKSIPLILKSSNQFKVNREGTFHGFMLYFNIKLSDDIELDNLPSSSETHWKKCFMPISNPDEVEQGDIIELEISADDDNTSWKWSTEVT